MDQAGPEDKRQQTVDVGILEVVIALAALSVGMVALPLQISTLVPKYFTPPIVVSGLGTFFFSYLALGDLYMIYIKEKGKEFRGILFGRERILLGWDPYWEVGWAIRCFGFGLIFLLAGILLNYSEMIRNWLAAL